MHRRYLLVLPLSLVLVAGSTPAWGQIAVTDPAVTARNAAIAVLKARLLDTLSLEREQLDRMARRLSALTSLNHYAVPDVPRWRTHGSDTTLYAGGYDAALIFGDALGAAYLQIARERQPAVLTGLSPTAREVVTRALATIDLTDAAAIAGTHQTGLLRFNGRRELAAIDALERHVVDPSESQSMTAVLDKVSGAVLLETRQKQARLQLLTALAEQLLIENKRTRDAEAAAMNMQLGRLRHGRAAGSAVVAGAGDDLRGWRQP